MTNPLAYLFAELVQGTGSGTGPVILNSRDAGLLAAIDHMSASDASRSSNAGATIAAHVQHLRYGLSLMNEWATSGGDPFANAKWDEAWKTRQVDETEWAHIRAGFRSEAETWLGNLARHGDTFTDRTAAYMGSIAHLAYHLGAIRQILPAARGPKEGTF
jgi:hypothetical protein